MVNYFGVATLVSFGEKRCRKNLPLADPVIVDTNAHAHRKLRRVARFRPLGLRYVPSVDVAYSLTDLPLSLGESVLGVYENIPDSLIDAIVFTDTHCHVATDTSWTSFRYSDIIRVVFGKFTTDKIETSVVVDLADGTTIPILVSGFAVHEYGAKTYDSYDVGMFLDAAKKCT